MSVKPITPDEVVSKKKEIIPDQVFDSFNEMIAKKWNGYTSVFRQKDIVELIADKMNIANNNVYEYNYLDVEDIYREVGWCVERDRPGYNESYDATFTFSRQKK